MPKKESWMACLDVPTAVIPGHIIKTVDPPCRPIACVPKGNHQVANAHLLAAAPDLLEGCKLALEWLPMLRDFMEDEDLANDHKAIKAAVAKARGKKKVAIAPERAPSLAADFPPLCSGCGGTRATDHETRKVSP